MTNIILMLRFCRRKQFLVALTVMVFFVFPLNADPWFTGPILAQSGETIPRGHSNMELYSFFIDNVGFYNRHTKVSPSPTSQSTQVTPVYSIGLAEKVDMQAVLPYVYNTVDGVSGRHVGDFTLMLGYQAWRQDDSFWLPSLRATALEFFPTGRFNQLSPDAKGTDSTGAGSYQTQLALNFQHLLPIWKQFYLSSRFNIAYTMATYASINGLNAYGGDPLSVGQINPGNLFSLDWSEELSITQSWVLVMEAFYSQRQASRFKGFLAPTHVLERPDAPSIGSPATEELTLAPAFEYNFTEHYGLIAGVWFTVQGIETSQFITYVLAFNAYW